MLKFALLTVLFLCAFLSTIDGHGRLIEPPSRSSAFRFGFKTPKNYNDNELNCGGRARQWSKEIQGKCGVCGDFYEGPYDNEAEGKYATDVIVRTYKKNALMNVKVEVTANHEGWFEFRLCKNDDFTKRFTQECLDKHVLKGGDGSTRWEIGKENKIYTYTLQLPAGLTCTQCVLQWKWNTGNSFGYDKTGEGCRGCGEQEQFYGCADIAIENSDATEEGKSKITPVVTASTTKQPTPTPTDGNGAVGDQEADNDDSSISDANDIKTTPGSMVMRYCMSKAESLRSDKWCMDSCNQDNPNCPDTDCQCFSKKSKMILKILLDLTKYLTPISKRLLT